MEFSTPPRFMRLRSCVFTHIIFRCVGISPSEKTWKNPNFRVDFCGLRFAKCGNLSLFTFIADLQTELCIGSFFVFYTSLHFVVVQIAISICHAKHKQYVLAHTYLEKILHNNYWVWKMFAQAHIPQCGTHAIVDSYCAEDHNFATSIAVAWKITILQLRCNILALRAKIVIFAAMSTDKVPKLCVVHANACDSDRSCKIVRSSYERMR